MCMLCSLLREQRLHTDEINLMNPIQHNFQPLRATLLQMILTHTGLHHSPYILCTDSVCSPQCVITVCVRKVSWYEPINICSTVNPGPEARRWNMCHSVSHAASHSNRHKSPALDQCPASHRRTAVVQHNQFLFCAATVRRADWNQTPSNINTGAESESAHWHSVVRGDSRASVAVIRRCSDQNHSVTAMKTMCILSSVCH